MNGIAAYRIERARFAYEAYRQASNGLSYITGQLLPDWTTLHEEIQQCWVASADAVCRQYQQLC